MGTGHYLNILDYIAIIIKYDRVGKKLREDERTKIFHAFPSILDALPRFYEDNSKNT